MSSSNSRLDDVWSSYYDANWWPLVDASVEFPSLGLTSCKFLLVRLFHVCSFLIQQVWRFSCFWIIAIYKLDVFGTWYGDWLLRNQGSYTGRSKITGDPTGNEQEIHTWKSSKFKKKNLNCCTLHNFWDHSLCAQPKDKCFKFIFPRTCYKVYFRFWRPQVIWINMRHRHWGDNPWQHETRKIFSKNVTPLRSSNAYEKQFTSGNGYLFLFSQEMVLIQNEWILGIGTQVSKTQAVSITSSKTKENQVWRLCLQPRVIFFP